MKIRGVFCVVFLLLGGVFLGLRTSNTDTPPVYADVASDQLEDDVHLAPGRILAQVLDDFAIPSSSIQRHPIRTATQPLRHVTRVSVPSDLPLDLVNHVLTRALQDAQCVIYGGLESNDGSRVTLRIGTADAMTDSVVLIRNPRLRHAKGRIAIVIDDLDTVNDASRTVLNLPDKLTLAIIPGHPASAELARLADAAGKEVLIHLPMETLEPPARDEPLRLMTGMTRSQVQSLFTLALKDIPHAVGVNNHEGSRGTADPALMGHLARVLRGKKARVLNGKNLLYLDSRTTEKSIAFKEMRRSGIPAMKRDIFLDNTDDPAAIRQQWELVRKMAQSRGSAVAIGHVQKSATLEVLLVELPRLVRQGYQLVFLSELL